MAGPDKTIEIPSRRYGTYRVRSRLGMGGMAEIFLAEVGEPSGASRRVALKMMRDGMDPAAFADEADLMGLLHHPNLVQRLEVGEAFGRLYIAMEFLPGGDLAGLMRLYQREGETFPGPMALYTTLEVLKGLAYFHQARTRTGAPLLLVHGDVNPSNVFFGGDGEVKLGDFGVATSRRAAIGPGEGLTAGKLRYLSPEQAAGRPLTPAADLFAVGVMLHELLLGRHPFLPEQVDQDEALDLMEAARLKLPEAVPRPLARLLERALQADPAGRFQTAGELAGGILHYALDAGLAAHPSDMRVWLQSVLKHRG